MPITNELDEIGQIYKGYFQIYDGTTPYQYDGIVELAERINATYGVLYSTRGKKRVIPTGNDSIFTITVNDTASLYDNANPPTDAKSMSYFIDKILSNVELPEIEFEGYNQTESSSDPYIRDRFKGTVVGTEKVRNNSTGVYERMLVIEITESIKPAIRASA